MNSHFEKVQSRRKLFISVLRYATLGVLGVVGGSVFAKKRRLVRNGVCINHGICQSCGILSECSLPRALSVKASGKENQ